VVAALRHSFDRLTVAGWVVTASLAALTVGAAYVTSPLVSIGLLAALAAALSAALAPVAGVVFALLAVPFEPLDLRIGGSPEANPAGGGSELDLVGALSAVSAGLTPAETMFVITAAIGVVWVVAGPIRVPSPVYLSFIAVLLSIAPGFFFATDTFVITKVMFMWSAFLFVSVLVGRASLQEIQWILFAIAIAGGAVGLFATITADTQEVIEQGAVATNRAEASFTHPNVLGAFLVLTLPPAIALAGTAQGVLRPARPLLVLCVFAIGSGLLLTLSRAAIFGAILALCVLASWRPFRRIIVAAVGLGAIFVALNADPIFGSPQLQLVGERLETVTRLEETAGGRFDLWETTPAIVADHPVFGVGMKNFPTVEVAYGLFDVGGGKFEHAHNMPLNVAAELGLLGLAAIAWWVFAVARTALQAMRRARGRLPLLTASVAALVGIGGVSLTGNPMGTNVVMATIMVYVGVLVAFSRATDRPGGSSYGDPSVISA
jgi:O-antigen ligase